MPASPTWFATSSLGEAARFAARVTEVAPECGVDIRPSGVLVRPGSDGESPAIAAAAAQAGLSADPAAWQDLSVVVDSADRGRILPFWHGVLGYHPEGASLSDPLRRDPGLRFEHSAEPRPLRQRIHLDVVRPGAAVAQIGLGAGFGPYGVCHADADGNEVDLVPGDPLGEGDATGDWFTVFGAVACYRTESSAQQAELVAGAAAVADRAGFPLQIDVRPGLVVFDTGKDRWEADVHGLDVDFADVAAEIQAGARRAGAIPDPSLPRFVQMFLDAADVPTVRGFWTEALGYVADDRPGVTDIFDPRGLGPVLLFQELDATDDARRRQRNRIHLELTVPAGEVAGRVRTAVSAGGRVIGEAGGRTRVADPEGNELALVGR